MKKLILAFALSAFFLSSCTMMYKEVKVTRVEDFELEELSSSDVKAILHMQVVNPNFYKITLSESDLIFMIDGANAGNITLAEPVVLPPRSTKTYDVKVNTNITNVESILGNALTLMFKSDITLEATGYVTAKGLGIKKEVPLTFKKVISNKSFFK